MSKPSGTDFNSEEMKALEKLNRDCEDYKASQPSDADVRQEQWKDYYEYTGMADFARECEEQLNKETQNGD